jgi:hypothetical protein
MSSRIVATLLLVSSVAGGLMYPQKGLTQQVAAPNAAGVAAATLKIDGAVGTPLTKDAAQDVDGDEFTRQENGGVRGCAGGRVVEESGRAARRAPAGTVLGSISGVEGGRRLSRMKRGQPAGYGR